MNALVRSTWAVVLLAGSLATAAQAQGPVYQFQVGTAQRYQMNTVMQQKMHVADQDVIVDMDMQMQVTHTVVAKNETEGTYSIKVKTDSIKATFKVPVVGEYTYDSASTENDTSSLLGQSVAPAFQTLVGSEVTVHVLPNGKINKVEGFTELMQKLLANNPGAAQFAGATDNETAVNQFQEYFVVLPNKSLTIGDGWEQPYELNLNQVGKMNGVNGFVYEGPDSTAAGAEKFKLSTQLNFEVTAGEAAAQVSGKLSTTNSSGVALVDLSKGKLVKKEQTFTVAGDLSLNAGGMILPLRMEQTQTVTITPIE